MKKIGRNDSCLCGSGKKFKKCCEAIMIGGRYKATKIDKASDAQIQKTVGLSAFFQKSLSATPPKIALEQELFSSPEEKSSQDP